MRALVLGGPRLNLAPAWDQQFEKELLAFDENLAAANDGLVFLLGPLAQEPFRVGKRAQFLSGALQRQVFGAPPVECEVGNYSANFTDENFCVRRAIFLFDRDKRSVPELLHTLRLANYCPLLPGFVLRVNFLLRKRKTSLLVASTSASTFARSDFASRAQSALTEWAARVEVDAAQLTKVLVVLGSLQISTLSVFDCECFQVLLVSQAEFPNEHVMGLIREDVLARQARQQWVHILSYAVQGEEVRREDAWLTADEGYLELSLHRVHMKLVEPILPRSGSLDRVECAVLEAHSPLLAFLRKMDEHSAAPEGRELFAGKSAEKRARKITKSKGFEERLRKLRSIESLLSHSRYNVALAKLNDLMAQPVEELLREAPAEQQP